MKTTLTKVPQRLSNSSQCAKILRALRDAKGNAQEGWVSMPKLVKLSGSYNIHTRVDELRTRWGAVIENYTDNAQRPHVSKYRLVDAGPHATALN